MKSFYLRHIERLLQSPKSFLVFCLGVSFFALIADGSLWRLYSLHSQKQILEARILQSELETNKFELLITRARDPKFLEKQAREKFDWVEEDELVFLFPNDK